MNSIIFNVSLVIGLLLIMAGVWGLHSLAAAALAGGVLVVALTLLLARWAGVRAPDKKERHVSD